MSILPHIVDPATVGLDADRLSRIDRHFATYVDDGRLPGWLVAVTRHGELAHLSTCGNRDVEAGLPIEHDTVFRIYSMTKPITSVVAMQLHEEGAFALTDPISRWLPAFADTPVYDSGERDDIVTVPRLEPIRVWHLLTHTAGLTNGFARFHPVDERYRAAGYEFSGPKGATLADACEILARVPLMFEPGSAWAYSVATDVLGRLIEVVTGQDLATVFAERVLDPLGMDDTGFGLPVAERHRLAGLYVPGKGGKATRFDALGPVSRTLPSMLSGGGGLVSTAADYLRFADALRRRGAYDGGRLLAPRTVDYMTENHLPGGADLLDFGFGGYSESSDPGRGFGLGVYVVTDPIRGKVPISTGTFGWGGAASTAFWVDPIEDMTVVFLTQLLPSTTWPIRNELSALVRQAIID